MVLNKRLQILGGYLAIVALLLVVGQPIQESSANTTLASVEAEYQSTGLLSVVYGDQQPGVRGLRHTIVTLIEADGDVIELMDVEPADYRALNGDEVRVRGDFVDTDPARNDDDLVLDIAAIAPINPADANDAAVTGNEQWLNIACRFGDMDETPQPMDYFESMMRNEAPGMDHYWRQTSSGLVSIEGSASYGWYDLPRDKAYYVRASVVNTGFALSQLLNDCANQLAQAEDVDFTEFGGINIMLNDTFGCCAWGGRMPLNVDGKSITFRTTWLPPWAFNSLHVIAHEMGHGWGLPHSSGPYGAVYDSAWDVMSGGTRMMDLCRIGREDLGCYQVGTIGYHLDMLGWLPDERVIRVNPGESAVITLDALTTVLSGVDTLLIEVPVSRSSAFYTVEARSFIGYDRNIPGEAVVLHEVVPTRQSPAHVVDADNDGDPNDEGAMWLPGETFSNAGVTIEVLNRLGNTFTVRVSNDG